MNLIEKAKLLFKLKAVSDAVEKESKMGYDFQRGASKALRDFAITCLAVGAASITAYFSIPENLATAFGVLPATVQTALIPLASSLFVFLHNYVVNRGK